MSDEKGGRLLPFLRRQAAPQSIEEWLESGACDARLLSTKQSGDAAKSYLAVPIAERSEELKEENLTVPEVLLALSQLLGDRGNVCPSLVAEEASNAYRWLACPGRRIGVALEKPYFPNEERDYFLGEMALHAARANRLLGKREEAERWIDRADAGFRHTVNSAPKLADAAYYRLALRYDQRRYEDVLDLLPSLVKSFESLGMKQDLVKCRFLEAMTLKLCGRTQESFGLFKRLEATSEAKEDLGLFAQIHIEIGEQHGSEGRYEQAMAFYQKALILLQRTNRPMALAHLRWSIGEMFRVRGKLLQALEAYQQAFYIFMSQEASTYAALLRLVVAETLLALNREREAEVEILAALPIIEEQKMVPEGFAAVALLRESVRRRKTDPEALRHLREQLQPTS